MSYDLCVTLDNKFIVSAIPTNELVLYDSLTLNRIRYIAGHKSAIPYVSSSLDGKYLMSGSQTETIIWSVPSFEKVAEVQEKVVPVFSKHRLFLGVI